MTAEARGRIETVNGPRRRGTARRMAAFVALAMAATLALIGLGGAKRAPKTSKPAAHAVQPQEAPAAQPAFWNQADVVGGYVSAYICLRLRDGVKPAQLADGSWTLQRIAANAAPQPQGDAPLPAAPLAKEQARARDILSRHRVTTIKPLYPFEFKRPELARQYGLDRSYLAYVDVAAGSDVRALATELLQAADLAPLIERVELDSVGSIAAIPNDPDFSQQWDMHNTGQTGGVSDADIDCPEAWDVHTGSASTVIAILDTGVQADHPDLNGKVIPGIDTYQAGSADSSDLNGHGTHCAGIAAAKSNNGIGVAGTNWLAQILAVRVTSTGGSSNQTDVSEGVIYAADNGADVISMSLQFFSDVNLNLQDAVAYAYDSGVLPVAAAGNSPLAGEGHVAWPARYPKCMAIAATTHTDARWFLSSFQGSCDGPELDVAAPGAAIYGLWRNSGYAGGGAAPLQSGTSMATPHVAGLAALLRSHNPALTVPEIEQIIRDTAEDVNGGTNPGFDNFLGFGRINVRAALDAAGPACIGDTNGTGAVDVDDLIAVILSWGACPTPPPPCDADVAPSPTGDGVVDVDDLVTVILNWGACS
jgi:subtilisin family serine protease